jgi:DNA-directed RNA polymerase
MMDNQLDIPEEFERSISKYTKRDLRSEALEGWGDTIRGKALTTRYHERLTEAFSVCLLGSWGGTDVQRLVASLKALPVEVLALSCLQSALHYIGRKDYLRETLLGMGRKIGDELWAAKITTDNPKLAAKVIQSVRARHAGSNRRIAAARRAALNAGYSSRIWSTEHYVKAGGFLWNVLSTALPDVFELVNVTGTTELAITLSDEALLITEGAFDDIISANPIFWPSAEVSKPWDAATGGGSHDPRVNARTSLVRSRHKSTQAAVRHAIKTGTMQPALDAVNTLQSVPFVINHNVLEVIQTLVGCAIEAPGFPGKNIPMPKKLSDAEFSKLTKQEMAIAGAHRNEVRKHNRGLIGDRVLFQEDMVTAAAMAKLERFHTPMNMDWRGRVYALSHFNFQREDRVRALFNFADGLPIGEEGLRWLKIHTANCGDFRVDGIKISKRTLQEREQWSADNVQLIGSIALAPLVHTEWMQAGKPFLFLAACFELTSALAVGPSYTTHLPISFDGSCSGLQHLSAMTRAAEGSMVNLTPSPLPQDVYQQVADDTHALVTADLDNPETAQLAQLFLDYEGSWRDIAKRNVMTYSYSSKKFGMSSQQQVDLMEPLAREVLSGVREDHPFEGYQHGSIDRPSKAARYIASHIFDAIEARIHLPAQAMHFLQKIAKAMAHEGKPVQWTTPVGLPWINRYHGAEVSTVELFLRDGGLRRRTRVSVATGDTKEIDKAKAANGVAPNFVHALDAAHLLLVANASALQGIRSIATVHDSFGCLAPQAARFNGIIREQFALMYERDVLKEILEQASCDLTDANQNRLPELPQYGTLNLKDILNADFAFA